jgi:hypothetical protein
MFKYFLDLIKKWSEEGMRWPFLRDPTNGKPSVTLLFVYLTFIVSVSTLVASSWYPRFIPPTMIGIGFWSLSMVFYRLRKLDKAKIDLKNDSIDLEGDDKPETVK